MTTKTATSLRLGLITLTLGAAVAVLGLNLRAHAATAPPSQGYQVSPPVNSLSLDPGTSIRQTVKVTNLSGTQLTLRVSKENFVAKGEEGQVELEDNADPTYSLAPYFSISQPTIVVPPRGTTTVDYTLTLPANAEPGGRYGSITFTTIAAKLPSGESGAAVVQDLASLILLRVNGAAHEQLAVASFAPDKTFYQYGPINFITRVQNLGNVHEKPTGEIVVKNMLGWTTKKITLQSENVLPAATRRLSNQLNRHLLFGKYTATLTLKNGTLQTLTAATSFWVLPLKLMAIVFVVSLLALLFFWKMRRRLARAIRILAGRE